MSTPAKALSLVCIAVASFIAGVWYRGKPQSPGMAPNGRLILYYRDPMHPVYKSDKPGFAPDCGMPLEPVYAGSEAEPPNTLGAMPAGAVQVSSQNQQSVGVRTEKVATGPGVGTVRLLGRVTLDETRIYRVAAAVDGWVRTAGPVVTGTIVQKDDVLATFYNRDFLTAQQTYLYALNTMDRFQDKESEEQLKLTRAQMRASEENLEFLGMGPVQLKEVARTRQIARDIELRSPVAGLVLARSAFAGLRFDRGAELFRIANLSHVWILADVFENDSSLVPAARNVSVRYRGKSFRVRMSHTLPQFDGSSRVLRVRLEMDNPDFVLRPDMFVDVELEVSLPPGIVVPVDAVLDSGLRKTVFVDAGNNYFVPRPVETGWRLGDRIQIVRGLHPGERIVVSGNFLLDSESRMRLAAAAPAGGAKDPVCGMTIDPAKAAGKSEYRGGSYSFCSKACKDKFDKEPGKYLEGSS